MTETIELEIVSSQKVALTVKVTDLYIPAYYGEAGILENHLPYISLLKMGEISYSDVKGNRHYMFIEDGFLESAKNKIVIVSDSIEHGEDMDEESISAQLDEVTKKIKASVKGEITPEELQEALESQRRLQVKANIIKKQKTKKSH
jgi:F-type H+-transporting ATPase subunit epsilon